MFLAIDIGGTSIKYAIINDDLVIVKHFVVPTATENQKEQITKQIDQIVNQITREVDVIGVGISTAGVVNGLTGEIIYSGPTMSTYVGTNLKHFIETKYGIQTTVMNDVNAACIGEKWLGSGKDYSNFLCITIGTGIGGAVFINDQLYLGKHYRAGEIGHSPIHSYENKSYEQVASMSSLLERAKAELGFIGDGKQLFERARQGNIQTNLLLDHWVSNLVEGMLPVLCTLDVEAIIVGGAVSQQGEFLLNKIRDQFRKLIIPSLIMPTINIAILGNSAALYGAIQSLYEQSKS